MAKLQPAVQTIFLQTPVLPSGNNQLYVDIGQCVSILSRRGYPQGCNWAVGGIKFLTASLATITTQKIPESWVTVSAWKKGKKLWNEMNDLVLDNNPSLKPKYYDFKVSMDSNQLFSANLLPQRYDGSTLTPYSNGDWNHSTIQLPNDPTSGTTTEKFLMMCGPTTSNRASIIEGYQQSRALVSSPEPDLPAGYDDNWMVQLFDMGENYEEIAQDIAAENDDPPYDRDVYIGSIEPVIHDVSIVSGTTVGSQTRIPGGMFPCGLIKFVISNETTTNFLIQIDLVPGTNRGYMALPMDEM